MSLNLPTNDLIRLVAAGGGLTVSARNFVVEDLIRIASAAANKRSRIVITDANAATVDNLIRIAAAGGGTVEFQ